MNIPDLHITVVCLFCRSALPKTDGAQPTSGDQIPCPACGESNDFDSVITVAKEKGVKQMKEIAVKEIQKELQKAFKNFK